VARRNGPGTRDLDTSLIRYADRSYDHILDLLKQDALSRSKPEVKQRLTGAIARTRSACFPGTIRWQSRPAMSACAQRKRAYLIMHP